MKIAISACNEGLESVVANRFGRCDYFVIYDMESKEVSSIENKAKFESHGAGGIAVRLLNEQGVKVALVPELGPRAMEVLNAYDIKAYSYKGVQKVKDAIQAYENDDLEILLTNTNQGHVGLRKA